MTTDEKSKVLCKDARLNGRLSLEIQGPWEKSGECVVNLFSTYFQTGRTIKVVMRMPIDECFIRKA